MNRPRCNCNRCVPSWNCRERVDAGIPTSKKTSDSASDGHLFQLCGRNRYIALPTVRAPFT